MTRTRTLPKSSRYRRRYFILVRVGVSALFYAMTLLSYLPPAPQMNALTMQAHKRSARAGGRTRQSGGGTAPQPWQVSLPLKPLTSASSAAAAAAAGHAQRPRGDSPVAYDMGDNALSPRLSLPSGLMPSQPSPSVSDRGQPDRVVTTPRTCGVCMLPSAPCSVVACSSPRRFSTASHGQRHAERGKANMGDFKDLLQLVSLNCAPHRSVGLTFIGRAAPALFETRCTAPIE